MSELDAICSGILLDLLEDFRARNLTAKDLRMRYEGKQLSPIIDAHEWDPVTFELAVEELEDKKLIETGPEVPVENDPYSGFMIFGVRSKREFALLTEEGYKAALRLPNKERKKARLTSSSEGAFFALHPSIVEKCGELYNAAEYATAAERGFRIVRERLRKITGYETGSDAFGKGRLHVKGAAEAHVEEDFNKAVQFLAMAIDRFRNEKAHTVDGNIEDPVRAYQYLALSSLALSLLEKAEAR